MPSASGRIVVCAAGLKGARFVQGLVESGIKPNVIVSYDQPDDVSRSFHCLEGLARESSSEFIISKRPELSENDLIFIVGWQYLLSKVTKFCVVFHDSLLPKYRGFAPTVAALIKGDTTIGVTALSPTTGVDEGPIVGQACSPISYPIKIKAALEIQSKLMTNLAIQIFDKWVQGTFVALEQESTRATYSIWRDDEDYHIDWMQSSSAVLRMIDAVGFPYSGARTTVEGETLTVGNASEVSDLEFEIRHPGKVWALDNGRPIVVCGSGLLRLDECRMLNGDLYKFRRLRVRLGK
jgi:methionyl-tRNA formyltransferase